MAENLTLGALRIRKIDFSGNQFGLIPEDLFSNVFSVEKIRWEKDKCHGSRVFPEAMFAQNRNLTSFWYSAATNSGCTKLHLPSKLFSVDDPNLSHLRLASSGLDWSDISPIVAELKKLQILDLSHNNITRVFLEELPSMDLISLNLTGNNNLHCE